MERRNCFKIESKEAREEKRAIRRVFFRLTLSVCMHTERMFRTPRQLPPFDWMLDDLPASKAQLARHLDLAESTITRYCRTMQVPRAVQLAVFWETQWGRSTADTEAANYGALNYALARARGEEIARLRARIDMLEKLVASNDKAANGPFFMAS